MTNEGRVVIPFLITVCVFWERYVGDGNFLAEGRNLDWKGRVSYEKDALFLNSPVF